MTEQEQQEETPIKPDADSLYQESLSDLEDTIDEQIGYLQSWRETVEEAQEMQETIEAIREAVNDISDMIEIHIRPPRSAVKDQTATSAVELSDELVVEESVEGIEASNKVSEDHATTS